MNSLILIVVITICLTCIVLSLLIPRILKNRFPQVPYVKPERPSDFPQYVGKDGRDVFVDFAAKYSQYKIEIVSPDSVDYLTKDFDANRVRIYVSRSGKVLKLYVG